MPPREDYLLHGPHDLGDSDLIALVLGTGVPGRSAHAIAAALLEELGSLLALANAPPGALARIHGVGNARAVRLHAALQLGLRAGRGPGGSRDPVTQPPGAAAWLVPRFSGLAVEEIHALFLDRRSRPVGMRRLSTGTDSYAVLDPALVLRPAIQLGAHQIILAHNHPSGDPEPSAEDFALTDRVARAARTTGLTLTDHLVVAGERWVSIASRGALA